MKQDVYVQPGGCVEITDRDLDGFVEGFVHICDWGVLNAQVEREIENAKPYRDPRCPK